jgi:hypothetical protein
MLIEDGKVGLYGYTNALELTNDPQFLSTTCMIMPIFP